MADNGDNVAGDFKFDWRDESAVSPVKKQKGDVCWAFVTIAAIESAHFLATGREKMITLSEQYLIDCDTLNKGYKTGQVSKALKFICDNGGGLYSDSDYPFAAEKRTCECQKHKIVARIHGHSPRDDEEALREAVQIQPVITCIDTRHLKVYKKGIYMYDPLFRVSYFHQMLILHNLFFTDYLLLALGEKTAWSFGHVRTIWRRWVHPHTKECTQWSPGCL